MILEMVRTLSCRGPGHQALADAGYPRLHLLVRVQSPELLFHFGRCLEPERHLLFGGDAGDVLLFLGDRIEDAAAVISHHGYDGNHESDEESAAGHGASREEEVLT